MDDVYRHLSNSYGKNHFEIDKPFQAVLQYFLGRVPDLSQLGSFAGEELYEVADYTDKVAHPRQVMWSINGERVDDVWLNPAERWVLERLFKDFGVNKLPYRGKTWLDHYASIYLISDPGIACILTVTNQTAYALYKYGDEELRKHVPSLIGETNEITYGATWFTELQGGNDLGANLVEASQDGDTWHVNGDTKYFASNAGLADMALVTARPRGAGSGAKGLGLFLVSKINLLKKRNFIVRRLKEKSGTVSVPTGEVEFHNSEAHPIGDLRKGIYYTMENLMVSRLSNAIGALGVARKSFLEAYYYAQKRSAFGKSLIEHPLVRRDLLDMEVYIEGTLALTFKAIDQFQKAWTDTPPYTEKYHYARLLTHIAKNLTSEMASHITRDAMELLGGLGFLNEYPIERLHREALITPIWEGTSNIQALDMLEVMSKKGAHLKLRDDLNGIIEKMRDGKEDAQAVELKIEDALARLPSYNDNEIKFYAKDILNTIGHAVASIMLLDIADKLGIERFATMSRLYARRHLEGKTYSKEAVENSRSLLAIDQLELEPTKTYA
ncbi:MAG TPA: acyl-CoA dehydrogenase family protein [Candidatus Acidoferrales bacterium]|nr:acyl-CoA dehydrogenase family protein [Candidatus Acidoferrales bacterium]